MNTYELLYEYSPFILGTIIKKVEQREKDIYHELRELNGMSRTAIRSNNTEWKQQLKDLLSIQGYQLTWEDIDGEDVIKNIQNTLYESGYTADVVESIGLQAAVYAITNGHYQGKTKALTNAQIEGLKTEVLTTVKRYAWAKDLDESSVLLNTGEFNRGAYSEGKMDLTIKLPKVGNRRQVRSEIKRYLEIFRIGDVGEHYIRPILESVWFSCDREKKEIVFHLSAKVVEEQCDRYLLDKYEEFSPFIEDGQNVLLFSEFIENVIEGDKRVQLRNYGKRIAEPIKLEEDDLLQELHNKGSQRKALISKMKDLNYSLWYGNSSKGGK